MVHIIVANKDSYYHESYWNGKIWVKDKAKAKQYKAKVPSPAALKEYDMLREQFSHAYPQFMRY